MAGLPPFINYDDEIKEVLSSASLDVLSYGLSGVGVAYGFGMTYSGSYNASASLISTTFSQPPSTSSTPINSIAVDIIESNKMTYNTSSGIINTNEDFPITVDFTFQGIAAIPDLPLIVSISSSKGEIPTLIEEDPIYGAGRFTGSLSITLEPTVDYVIYLKTNDATVSDFDFKFSATSSIYGGSYSGSIIDVQADNVISTTLPSIIFYIPSDSYLEYGSTTSGSIVKLLEDYNSYPVSSGSLNSQVVIAQGEMTALACNISSCWFGSSGVPISWQGNSYLGSGIIPSNRNQFRAIKGGISITSTSNSAPFSVAKVGTLGLICQDSASNALVGLTNNHVIIRDAFYTDQRDTTSNVIQNEFDLVDGYNPTTGNYTGLGSSVSYHENVFQSGEPSVQSLVNRIGRAIRYVPMYTQTTTLSNPTLFNYVDGALCSLECSSSLGPVIDFTASFRQEGLNYLPAMPFATTAEINSLATTNPELYSSGRTTGAKSGSCGLRFHSFMNTPIAYNLQGTSTPAFFKDTIVFVKPENSSTWAPTTPSLSPTSSVGLCPYPVWGGDSGSVLIANFGGVWKIVGLVFAGNGQRYPQFPVEIPSTFGLACRIDHVANELGIKAWTGSIAPVVDHTTIDFITISGSNDTKILNCSGSTYWQVGLTKTHNVC